METREATVRLFQEYMENLRLQGSPTKVPTLLPWQGRISTAVLLKEAAERAKANGSATVRLLTGTCPGRVYDQYFLDCVRTLVSKKVEIRILVWDFPYDIPLASEPGVSLRFAGRRSETNHFLVVDEIAYRHEERHPYFPPSLVGDDEPPVSASVCFNDPENAATLVMMFEHLWAKVDSRQRVPVQPPASSASAAG